jgi:hypothetical protein
MPNDLWPDDITSEAVLSPARILLDQAEALATRTNNLLEGQVRRREDGDRVILGFEIVPRNIDTRVRLFEVHHRTDFGYPAAIVLPDSSLPDYLKEKRYVPSGSNLLDALMTSPTTVREGKGSWIENDWIASSPQKFIEKIATVFALPVIKTSVLSLLARANEAANDNGLIEEPEHEIADSEGECPS